jgi:hypothetical protein
MKKISRLAAPLALLASFSMPILASAQTGINLNAIKPYSSGIITVINSILVPVLFAIAFVTFLWGVYNYFILGADNEAERSKGKDFTLWGVIGFVVILSLWGIVNMVMSTFGFSATNVPAFPAIGTGTYVPAGGSNPLFGGGTQAGGGTGAGGGTYYQTAPTAAQISQATAAFNGCITAGSSQTTCDNLYQTTLSALVGAVTGTVGGKAFGYSCTDSSECASGLYCGADNVCTTATAGDKPNGYSCTVATQSQCASGYCDPADGTCSTPSSGGSSSGTYSSVSSCFAACPSPGTCTQDNVSGAITCVGGTSDTSSSSGIPFGYSCTDNPGGCASGYSCVDEVCQ